MFDYKLIKDKWYILPHKLKRNEKPISIFRTILSTKWHIV